MLVTDVGDRKSSFYQKDVNNLYDAATQNLSKILKHEHQDATNIVSANVTVKAQQMTFLIRFLPSKSSSMGSDRVDPLVNTNTKNEINFPKPSNPHVYQIEDIFRCMVRFHYHLLNIYRF